MTLSDEIAATEQRARDAVSHAMRYRGKMAHVESDTPLKTWCGCDCCVALARYAAVCKLAGRAQGYLTPDEKNDIRAELAVLVKEMEEP